MSSITAWDSGTESGAEHALDETEHHHLFQILRRPHSMEAMVKPAMETMKNSSCRNAPPASPPARS